MYKKLNYATGVLSAGISDSATEVILKAGHTITTETGEANKFVGVFFDKAKSSPFQDNSREIVEAYRTDTNTFTIARAKEGTFAKSWVEDDNFMLIASSAVFDEYEEELGYKENVTNKKTTITDSDTDYLTSKAVKTAVDAKEDALGFTPENVANKRTSFQDTPTDDAYISEKLAKDSLDTKAPITSPTFETSITGSYLTASEILITDANKKIVSAPVATYPSLTELSYVKGVSSAIQTQLGGKMANPMTTAGDIIYGGDGGTPTRLAKGTAGQVLTMNASATAPEWAAGGGGFPPDGYILKYENTFYKLGEGDKIDGVITVRQAYCIDDDYVYFAGNDQRIHKINKSDLTDTKIVSDVYGASVLSLIIDGNFLYMGGSNNNGYFIKKYNKIDLTPALNGSSNPIVSPDTGAAISVLSISGDYIYSIAVGNVIRKYNKSDLTYTSVENPAYLTGSALSMITDSTYLYIVGYNQKMRKYNLSDLTYTNVESTVVGDLYQTSKVLDSGYIYWLSDNNFYKINATDLSGSFIPLGVKLGSTNYINMVGDYFYISGNVSPLGNRIIKMNKNSLAIDSILNEFSSDIVYGINVDGNNVYILGFNGSLTKLQDGAKRVILTP